MEEEALVLNFQNLVLNTKFPLRESEELDLSEAHKTLKIANICSEYDPERDWKYLKTDFGGYKLNIFCSGKAIIFKVPLDDVDVASAVLSFFWVNYLKKCTVKRSDKK